jgi:cyclic di-GMP phosphodiesterase
MPRVLAVDDQELNLELLGAYLAGAGFDFSVARSGAEALEAISVQPPDVVLLDVMMPGVSGFEVCRRIKSDPKTQLLPVVLVTCLHEVEDRVHGLEVGADDYFTKPLDRDEVVTRVMSLVRTKELYDQLDGAEQVMLALARAVAAKDGGTQSHVERVARASRKLGTACGLQGSDLENLYFGGIVHDVGKIGVPDSILLKPGPLDRIETRVMRTHVTTGCEIARPLRSAAGVMPIIRHHHESFDGSGYPDRLSGDAIPLAARIVAVCDAHDAMTSDRPYRRALSHEWAAALLEAGAGTQWDPTLVGTYLDRVLPELDESPICARHDDEVIAR